MLIEIELFFKGNQDFPYGAGFNRCTTYGLSLNQLQELNPDPFYAIIVEFLYFNRVVSMFLNINRRKSMTCDLGISRAFSSRVPFPFFKCIVPSFRDLKSFI
jgi:hypothetical protein